MDKNEKMFCCRLAGTESMQKTCGPDLVHLPSANFSLLSEIT